MHSIDSNLQILEAKEPLQAATLFQSEVETHANASEIASDDPQLARLLNFPSTEGSGQDSARQPVQNAEAGLATVQALSERVTQLEENIHHASSQIVERESMLVVRDLENSHLRQKIAQLEDTLHTQKQDPCCKCFLF